MKKTDVIFFIIFMILSFFIVYTLVIGKFETYYFPEIYIKRMDAASYAALISEIIYMSFVII